MSVEEIKWNLKHSTQKEAEKEGKKQTKPDGTNGKQLAILCILISYISNHIKCE